MTIHSALSELVAKLDEIDKHPGFQGIWVFLKVHGCEYNGPDYGAELAAARAALAAAPQDARDTALLDWLESTRDKAETELGIKCGWYVDESGAPIMRGELEALWSRTLRAAIAAAIARKEPR